MYTPLSYQVTEYDCGTTSFINAVCFLYERNKIPVELIKAIYLFTLDVYDDNKVLGQGGTSKDSMSFLVSWIKRFALISSFKIECEYLDKSRVNYEVVKRCIKNKGCAVLRTYQVCEHYVLITNMDDDYVYIFDPYYLDRTYYSEDNDIDVIDYKYYNRRVKLNRLNSFEKEDYAFGPVDNRECIIFHKK